MQMSSTLRFLQKENYVSKELPADDATHLLMDGAKGGKVSIPWGSVEAFFTVYGIDLHRQVPVYVIEKKTDNFRLFFDIDLPAGISDEVAVEVLRIMSTCTAKYLQNPGVADAVACAVTKNGVRVADTGLHVVFPKSVVNQEIALSIRSGIEAELQIEMPNIDWDKVIDLSVLTTNGLRMVGADKVKSCKECKNSCERRQACLSCNRQGKYPTGKIYYPWRTYPENAEFGKEINLKVMLENLGLAAKTCSIRLRPSTSLSAYVFPFGAPPASVIHPLPRRESAADRKAVISTEFASDRRETNRQAKDTSRFIDKDCAIFKSVEQIIRAYDPVYSTVELYTLAIVRGKDDTIHYRANLRGYGSSVCFNKMNADGTVPGEHTSNHVYFVIKKRGLSQACYSSNRDASRGNGGTCKNFMSSPKALPEKLFNELFDVRDKWHMGSYELARNPLLHLTNVQRLIEYLRHGEPRRAMKRKEPPP